MSLYNMLHGQNPLAGLLLSIIDVDQANGKWSSGRFRDVFLNADGTEILLYTRNGGGNRECWRQDECDGTCPGCVITEHLPTHPLYIRDRDDDFDCTYATVWFRVPEPFLKMTTQLANGVEPQSVGDMFRQTLAELQGMDAEDVKADKRFAPACGVLTTIIEALDAKPGGEADG